MNQQIYVLRVDQHGNHYTGYVAEYEEGLENKLEIDPDWKERIAITDELRIVCNQEGAVMGLPLNRALYDAEGKLVMVIGGNLYIQKTGAKNAEITSEDVEIVESRLKAIHTISHGFVFLKEKEELLEWKNKNN